MENVFPDRNLEKATTLLHTTLYQLRKNLGELAFNNGIIYSNGEYKLNLPIESDLNRLDTILNSKENNSTTVSEILDIYKGDFLEFEAYHWALGMQVNYKGRVLDRLVDFINFEIVENDNSPLLLRVVELIYKMEPFDCNIAGLIIRYFGKLGHKGKLDKFFNYYKERLWKELQTKPMEETEKLYKKYI